MEKILALRKRPMGPPGRSVRESRPIALGQRLVVLGGIISFLFGLLSQAQATRSITLAWNASGGSGIAGYRVYYGTSSGHLTLLKDVGNTTTTSVSNLLAGETYFFAVTDYNSAKLESIFSNQVSFTATPDGPIPKDFNGNGFADLLWENMQTGNFSIWLMKNGVMQSNISVLSAPGWRAAGIGDFMGDGSSGIVVENTSTGQRRIWMLNHGVYSSTIILPTVSTDWHIAGAGDFNGNGQADLVWENTRTGDRAIWFLKKGVFSSSIGLGNVSTQWRIAGVGDFRGAGEADLVWENTATGEHAIWFLQNGGYTSSISLPTTPTQWRIAGAADFDGDGEADLVWENTSTGARAIWFMKQGVLKSSTTIGTVPTQWEIAEH